MPSGFNLTILIEYQLIRRQKRTRGALFCLILGGEEEVKEETPFPIIFSFCGVFFWVTRDRDHEPSGAAAELRCPGS